MKVKIEAIGDKKKIYNPELDKRTEGRIMVAQIFIEDTPTDYVLWRDYDANKYEIKDSTIDGFV